MKRFLRIMLLNLAVFSFIACEKENGSAAEHFKYYEVGFKGDHADWRDSSIVVRTSNQAVILQVDSQLALPVETRKLVVGTLVPESGGYNKNASHEFKWHIKEDDWQLTDITIEIYDGKPYTDVDVNLTYWLDTVKRFGAWSSYIKRKLPRRP